MAGPARDYPRRVTAKGSAATGTADQRRGRTRLSAEARRTHLLDTAAEIVLTRGFEALTMEAVGQEAGTSKTLGYAYFANVDDLVLSLYQRELSDLFRRVAEATETADTFRDKLTAAVHAYFDVVAERGILIGLLQAGVSSRRLQAGKEPRDEFLRWLAALVREEYGCSTRLSYAYAGISTAVADLHARSWNSGRFSRRQVEDNCVEFLLAGLEAVLREG